MSRLAWSGLILASVVAVAGCHHKPASASKSAPPAAAPTVTPTPPPPSAALRRVEPADPAALSEEDLFHRKTLEELNAEHPLSDAFFEYDEYQLKDDQRAALDKDAAWLKRWPQTVVMIEGHCDERGTAEYNLALGSRRATAVMDYLKNLGIATDRIRMTSLGKEAPFCNGTSEECWSQNRRGHFIITAK